MLRRVLAVTIACAWVAGCGGRSSGPAYPIPANVSLQSQLDAGSRNPNELPEPPVVRSVNGIASVDLGTQLNPSTNMPEFVYDGQTNVAPTIELNPGETIEINLANGLPPAKGMQNDVNLHFHGLTVSPKRPADDVLSMYAKPGQKLHYTVHVPKNQEPGLYWYHPHVHGIVNLQVGEAGMSGAIVIDGLERHIPGLAKMRQRLMILRETGIVVPARPRPEDMSAMDAPDAMATARPNFNNNPCGPETGVTVSLNGAVQPVITMAPGERQFFRLVNASSHKTMKVAVDGQPIQMIAIDGFAYDTYPGNPPTLTEPYAIVPPAARAEFVVTAPKSGHAKLRSLCYDSGFTGDRDPELVLASIEPPARGTRAPAIRPAPLTVGSPLPNNAYTTALPPIAAKRRVIFSEGGGFFRINGKIFSIKSPPMFVVRAGTVEQWTVENTTLEVHDFHIHQVHFLVESFNRIKPVHPYWADSIVLPHQRTNGRPGTAVLLMDFRDPIIKGTFVFHCHILDHEDHGMMAKIEVI
jgi:suppressor of ftsI